MTKKFDFGGYATKANLKCADGRTIMPGAFRDCNGKTVPLVWQHMHDAPQNVLGHALLEERPDGVYAYCTFNNTAAGKNASALVQHKDVVSLSIYANGLIEQSKNVIHGIIREVSLVMVGANPGAIIDYLAFEHSDGSTNVSDTEAIIYTGGTLDYEDSFSHADKSAKGSQASSDDETVADVFETLNEKQKLAVYAVIAEASGIFANEGEATHSAEEGDFMKHNVFDGDVTTPRPTLTAAQFKEILEDAQHCGSLKESFLAHAQSYGIENIDFLFPDAQTITDTPAYIKRKTEWVAGVLSGTRHTPFSRIKTVLADITADEARARGYVTGDLKKEEVVKLLKRVTTPTTVYKKQKLDRDDIIDVTDMSVVSWLKAEMRMMLDEELARAVLIGDGRNVESPDKINEENIRPIYSDDVMYSHKVRLENTATTNDFIKEVVRSRNVYRGTGTPTLYTTTAMLTEMLLLEDTLGHRLYDTTEKLKAALRVSDIVEVPSFDGVHRTSSDATPVALNLLGILVNLSDYAMGADKGGEVSFFDDFDIDYNQQKYLIETRCSGALTMPKSAIVFEKVAPVG